MPVIPVEVSALFPNSSARIFIFYVICKLE